MKLADDFAYYAEQARRALKPGKVSWANSQWAWMLNLSPMPKSQVGRSIIEQWADRKGWPWQSFTGDTPHMLIAGKRVNVHTSLLDKEGSWRFSQLREDDKLDYEILLAVEPHRARIFRMAPFDAKFLPGYKSQVEGLHVLTFGPDDVPKYLKLMEVFEG